MPCLGSEYSCSEQHLAPSVHETLISSHCVGKQTVHLPLMAKKDVSESYSHCHFCPGAGVIFASRLGSSMWREHAVMSAET